MGISTWTNIAYNQLKRGSRRKLKLIPDIESVIKTWKWFVLIETANEVKTLRFFRNFLPPLESFIPLIIFFPCALHFFFYLSSSHCILSAITEQAFFTIPDFSFNKRFCDVPKRNNPQFFFNKKKKVKTNIACSKVFN